MVGRLGVLVFDMDGTLFDSRTVVPDSYIAAITSLGGPRHEREDIVAAYSIGPPKAMLHHLLGRPSRDRDIEAYYARLGEAAVHVEVYPGMRRALQTLYELLPLAVYSGASTRACRILLDACDMAQFFRVILGADEVGRPKPAPDGIEEACRRLALDPHDAAYVGDAEYDLEAARRSRALAVAAAWGHMYHRDMQADVVLQRPADLLDLINR